MQQWSMSPVALVDLSSHLPSWSGFYINYTPWQDYSSHYFGLSKFRMPETASVSLAPLRRACVEVVCVWLPSTTSLNSCWERSDKAKGQYGRCSLNGCIGPHCLARLTAVVDAASLFVCAEALRFAEAGLANLES
eukprot:m.177517 g.177517  ORF g.177517 m.177517 type:complete len:135 (+) comp16821_c0_seq1:1622-2026(+)